MSSKPWRLLAILQSVLASAFGVQSEKKYKEDFSQSTVVGYLAVGVLFVVILIIALVAFSSWLVS